MTEINKISLACGTIVGRHHVGISSSLLVGKPNQDAIGFYQGKSFLIATVHDGCSAGRYSEIGARLGAGVFIDCIAQAIENGSLHAGLSPDAHAAAWESIRMNVLSRLYQQALLLKSPGSSNIVDCLPQIVRDYFLFTTAGILITAEECTVFAVGDGYYALNGVLENLGEYEENAPPYISYGMIKTKFDRTPELLKIQIKSRTPLSFVDTVMVSTDGLTDFIKHEDTLIPGKKRKVGPVSQFWDCDEHFTETYYDEEGNLIQTLTRLLRQVNSESNRLVSEGDQSRPRIKRDPGLLQDDLSLICLKVRRESLPEAENDNE